MKKMYFSTFVMVLCILLASCNMVTTPDEEVLFIGNSYTAANDLPSLFQALAQSGGHNVAVDSITGGGLKLEDHASSASTLGTIGETPWDFVVLQEQSVIPSLEQERTTSMYPAATSLNKRIKTNSSKTIFFMTWARRDGMQEVGFTNFADMQKELEIGYTTIADELRASVAPVGLAWQNALSQNPDINLWESDGSHPNLKGSYLTAAVFYAVIYQESPEGLSYTADLAEDDAQFLQRIAAETVFK